MGHSNQHSYISLFWSNFKSKNFNKRGYPVTSDGNSINANKSYSPVAFILAFRLLKTYQNYDKKSKKYFEGNQMITSLIHLINSPLWTI